MEQGPAVPTYVLRGHDAPIHALQFYCRNKYLASGDSEGWLVIWSLATKRPTAVWKAHEGALMAIRPWGHHRLVTHGRDHKLRVWHARTEDLAGLGTSLPNDGATLDQPQPWLLHSLSVSALNFCAFSICDESVPPLPDQGPVPQLIASPNGLDSGGIDIFQLPSERRVSQLQSDKDSPTGMVMAVSLFRDPSSSRLVLISGYEDGSIMVHCRDGSLDVDKPWQKVTTSKPHSQPVLSLDVSPSREHFVTSGADATIAKFTLKLSDISEARNPEKSVNTKHAGQQGLSYRSDGKILATAGWDGRVRVYSAKTLKELAVLKWHTLGCYATAFADVNPGDDNHESTGTESSTSQATDVLSKLTALDLIKQQRAEKARLTHWLAAGGKDGKISLWDIY
ncbi:Astra associated protein 1 Asa1 [Elasticomyces elasticus]|uniref:ASTRA-associated protein 1 n=1 Tax=Exophiala sideris TaxID=1016849 RepID=A0ABR0JH80_9EURO|nr:Astra associated protein 1 Asa1 [Elasticomyces elasticus]KAK5033521.1 Astra associated protein 1 Asa1 [Exophiala sideris]KAK5041984.1 Astra associated protein 1 Asa1 [Exophiala sideris]KAK5064065.1 Astra associated protein 1 Asa1 [Exophiala sideris]KAK5185252.1 Astra associated protein 1 Asa1 [Eurotiomycetes sp. CCFEE 6388]